MATSKPRRRFPLVTTLIDNFGFSPGLALVAAIFITCACLLAVAWVVQSAPPRNLKLASGPEGSSFHRWATSYQKELAKHGVTLEIIPSSGSLDNLHRLQSAEADIGFVAGGSMKEENLTGLMSLGSISNQPLWIFYRDEAPIQRLSQLEGRRIAIGTEGSATRALALAMLQSNGLTGAPTVFSDLDSSSAAEALLAGKLDAVFLMGDSASTQTLRSLVRAPGVQLFSFSQADAYQRRYAFLNRIPLPQGSIDLGKNLPAQDVTLVGPTVELVAREELHAALSDLLLDVAKQVHGRAGLLQRRAEFPALTERDIPLSDEAVRYFKSGKGFLHRVVGSFWVASLLNRLLVVVVPLALVIIPAIRLLPVAYRLRIQLRLYRCYRPLLRIEQESFEPLTTERAKELLERLDEIEDAVNHLKIPASFADRFYWLRTHLLSVRDRVQAAAG
jgi:TRAP-type uncharacterized transport system substrate-binding protein